MAAEMTPPAAAPAFLARAGWDNARIEPLAGDASFRRYFRVIDADRRAVLMDAPPPHEDPRPFLSIARYLCAQGFAAPAILAEDLNEGLVLLEDFGDARMREMVDAGKVDETATYAATVALLAELHRHPPATVPTYARSELHREAGLLTEWYCPAVGLSVDIEGYRAAWDIVFDRIDDAPPVTVLRDYHAENIMLRDGLSGHAHLGLLDFQDALVGHPAYDLVSMLQDARRDVPLAIERTMLVEYKRLAHPGLGFLNSYAILGAQRNAKIVGIFTRLWQRDGKPRYLDFLPRVWGYLERDLAHPALAEVREWFDVNIPADRRGGYLKEPL
jgi:aminoglycoside/choline kinase family phosphotransferase